VLFAFPAAHVGADFGNDLQRGMGSDAVDLAEVGAAGEPVEEAADIKGWRMLGSPFAARIRQWYGR
jgi:hypothetical protein